MDTEPIIINQQIPELIPYPQTELPTTPEIAQKGVTQYKHLINALSDNERENFLKNKDIKRCFVGTQPEIGAQTGSIFELLNGVQLTQIVEKIHNHAPDFILVRHSAIRNETGRPIFSLINLLATEHIIKNNPDLFPLEAQNNPRSWIADNPSLWWKLGQIKTDTDRLIESRYGLLSGYTKAGSLAFPNYWTAFRKLTNFENSSEDDRKFLHNYTAENYTSNPEMKKRMENLLSSGIGDNLNTNEKDLLINAHRVNDTIATSGFLGVDYTKDLLYTKSLDKIYVDSGIDLVQQEKIGWKTILKRLAKLKK